MKTLSLLKTFRKDEDGALTVFGLFLFMAALIFGGLSLDVSYAYKTRTEIQVAADAAAHAALYVRQTESVDTARAEAIAIVQANLPTSSYGEVLRPEDINFGTWDAENEVFTIDNNLTDAVLVNTAQLAERGNAARAFLLKFAGVQEWDINTQAVFETYMPTCFDEGFVAEEEVDIQSNNSFTNGFCIHSNTHVKLSSGNSFGENTVVSMPDTNDLELPNSGFDSNEGLREALTDMKYRVRILAKLDEIMDGLWFSDPIYVPDYIHGLGQIRLNKNKLDASDFEQGRIHTADCGGGGKLSIEQGTLLEDIVLLTDCQVQFGSDVTLENVIIVTTNTNNSSIKSASGLQIGRDDNCLPDGGAQILTKGGVSVPADMKMFGGQIIAEKDVEFSANANGIEGASIISGGKISGTSNMTMGFCSTGMERNFSVPYFKLAG